MWLAEREVSAPQAAPHFTKPGIAAEPFGQLRFVGHVGDVSRQRAGGQLPPVDDAILFLGHWRSFGHGMRRYSPRIFQNLSLLRGHWAIGLTVPSRPASSPIVISSRRSTAAMISERRPSAQKGSASQ